jgi:release factor glutamine methyltransferase
MRNRTATSAPERRRKSPAPLSLRKLLADCSARLRAAGISNAAQEANWLLESGLGLTSLQRHLAPEVSVSDATWNRVMALCDKRVRREPLQYLLGTEEFCGLEFMVGPDVLIPRPETELLVEIAARHCADMEAPLLLEVGTGSGCVAVAMAVRLPQAQIYATDLSRVAIRWAALNAAKHGVSRRIRFLVGDLFQPVNQALNGRVSAVVSNPPYIPDGDLDGLQPEVRFEPRMALAGGFDGLGFHRRIIGRASMLLASGGLLALELGQGQALAVRSLLQANSWYDAPRMVQDAGGIERVITATRKVMVGHQGPGPI